MYGGRLCGPFSCATDFELEGQVVVTSACRTWREDAAETVG